MSIDLDALRLELKEHLGVSTELDSTALDLLLNRSYWEILDKVNFREQEVTAHFNVAAGVNLYDVPNPFESIKLLSIENPDTGEHQTLDRCSQLFYENNYQNIDTAQGKPTQYLREGGGIRLLPTPDNTYTLTIKYITTLQDLSDNKTTLEIPQSWHEIILLGGVWRGFMRLGDYARCNQVKGHQVNLIAGLTPVEAKEEVDSSHAGLEVRWE
jgi:hypothetical protein